MNGFAATGLFFVAIPSVIVGIFILAKGFKTLNGVTLVWSAFLFSVGLWGFGMYKIGTATDPINSIYWWRIAELGVILIPVLLTHFVISFLGLKRRLLLSVFYLATIIFLYCNVFTDYFIDKIYFAFDQFYYISKTPLYTFFIGIFVTSVIYILIELSRAYKKTTGPIHLQIKYLIWIFAVGFSGGVTSYLPVYNINVYPAWNATIVISMLLITYIIFKHHFMDIKVIATQVIAIVLSSVTLVEVFSSKTTVEFIISSIIFVMTALAGVLLIRSVLHEVNRREETEKLAKELQKTSKDLKKANKELERLDVAKSEFLSIASHQLRTPLTVIKGYVSMMLEGSYGKIPKQIKINLEKIYTSNERLINLVESLLNISRIESGRLEFNIQSTDLTGVCSEIVDGFKPKADKRGLKLEFTPDKNLPKVAIDQQKIKEVISNLIDNSIKYTEKGTISVSLHQESQSLIFSCQDTGIGVLPEDLPRLFEKFVRGKGMMRVYTEGTGLGLYFARMVIENMGGRIWAESVGKNKGSKFSFSVPLADKSKAKKVK